MVLIHQIMDKSLVPKSEKGFCKPSKTESKIKTVLIRELMMLIK